MDWSNKINIVLQASNIVTSSSENHNLQHKGLGVSILKSY